MKLIHQFLALSLCAVQIFATTCTYQYVDTTGTYNFDVSKLKKNTGYYSGTDGSYDYEMNVCDVVNTVAACTSGGALICQFNLGTLNYVATVASWSKSPDAVWSIIDPTAPAGGAKQTYKNGDTCIIFGQPRERTAIVNYRCDATVTTPSGFTISEDPTTCTFTIDMKSKYACAGGGGGGGGGSDSDLGGWIFIIILVVIIPVYIIVGCIYKATRQGTTGIESCPNIDFWRDLPHLIKDGFRFTFSGCKKGGDSHYDEL